MRTVSSKPRAGTIPVPDEPTANVLPWEAALDRVETVTQWTRPEIALLFRMLVALGWTAFRADAILRREGWLG